MPSLHFPHTQPITDLFSITIESFAFDIKESSYICLGRGSLDSFSSVQVFKDSTLFPTEMIDASVWFETGSRFAQAISCSVCGGDDL